MATKGKIYEYRGQAVVIRFEARRCIHAEECIKGLPGVFEKDRRPWIDPEQASPAQVVDVVARCPTGALRVERQDGGPGEPEPHGNRARVAASGPVYVEGSLELKTADGSHLDERRVALCRCGDSRNKPFCDNSHVKAGFADDGSLGVASMAPVPADATGPLVLSAVANGPMLFQGPLELVGADGEESQRGSKGALCRCGASQNKPYCDGSHAAAGFEAE